MSFSPFDHLSSYEGMLDTFKKKREPGLTPTVTVNFVIDHKIVQGERCPPEQRLAKHCFPCDGRWIPDHPSVNELKKLTGFHSRSRVFLWERLKGIPLQIFFEEAPERGCQNPVVELRATDSHLAQSAVGSPRHHPSLSIDVQKFLVQYKRKSCQFSDCNEFHLFRLLYEANGKLVEHCDIENELIGNDTGMSNRIATLKYRLAKKLRDADLEEVAAAIIAGKEKYRLALENL